VDLNTFCAKFGSEINVLAKLWYLGTYDCL